MRDNASTPPLNTASQRTAVRVLVTLAVPKVQVRPDVTGLRALHPRPELNLDRILLQRPRLDGLVLVMTQAPLIGAADDVRVFGSTVIAVTVVA